MLEIPAEGDQPSLKLFDSLDELREHTGLKTCTGYFDAKTNSIIATYDSVAHELGHFKDFKSGKMKILSKITDSEERKTAKLRNELVAIIFAFSRAGLGAACLDYELRFIEWFCYSRRNKDFGPEPKTELKQFEFFQIQKLADWLSQPEHEWADRLRFIFRTYLVEEQTTFTY